MKLTEDQVPLFWALWKEVCEASHWTPAHGYSKAQTEAKRKELLARCGFKSLKDVDPRDGFSLVKRELLKEAARLQGAKEEVDPTIERARTLRWVLEHELARCLALYHPAPMEFILEIAADKTRWRTREGMGRPITLDDLDATPTFREVKGNQREGESQLDQLVMTVSARLNEMRNAAGDTGHEMCMKAGVRCKCAKCRKGHTAQKNSMPEAVQAGADLDPDNEPF